MFIRASCAGVLSFIIGCGAAVYNGEETIFGKEHDGSEKRKPVPAGCPIGTG